MFLIRQKILNLDTIPPTLVDGGLYGGCNQFDQPLYGGTPWLFGSIENAFNERDRLRKMRGEQGEVYEVTLTLVPEPERPKKEST